MSDDSLQVIHKRLDEIVFGLHKREINDVELKGEMKLLRQTLQSMEMQFTLSSQSLEIRIAKLEESELNRGKELNNMRTELKSHIAKISVYMSIAGIIGLTVLNFVVSYLRG